MRIPVICVLSASLTGCHTSQPRFVTVGQGGLALDTKTGQSCLPFRRDKSEPEDDQIPYCSDLYEGHVSSSWAEPAPAPTAASDGLWNKYSHPPESSAPPPTDIAAYLDATPADNETKAQAWDVYYKAANQNDFTQQMKKLNLPHETKAQLWEMKYGSGKSNTHFTVLVSPDGKRIAFPDGTPVEDVAAAFSQSASPPKGSIPAPPPK